MKTPCRHYLKRLVKRALGLTNSQLKGYDPSPGKSELSIHALQTAKLIRGVECKPNIILHGVMPRSGTNYIAALLKLHPDIYAYPNNIKEVPFLKSAGDIVNIQKHFFQTYPQNKEKIGENDFLPLFGASFIAYLHSFVPKGQRILVKVPDVQYLDFFFSVFPYENLLVLLRDGRDVVNSSIETWPQKRFSDLCGLWGKSAQMILDVNKYFDNRTNGYWMTRYEDVFVDPVSFVKNALRRYGLEENKYPFEKIKEIGVIGSSNLKPQGEVTWVPIDKPKSFNPIGRWKEWPTDKKRNFKKIAGQTLIESGYCEDLSW